MFQSPCGERIATLVQIDVVIPRGEFQSPNGERAATMSQVAATMGMTFQSPCGEQTVAWILICAVTALSFNHLAVSRLQWCIQLKKYQRLRFQSPCGV